jgi:hypothetical protein
MSRAAAHTSSSSVMAPVSGSCSATRPRSGTSGRPPTCSSAPWPARSAPPASGSCSQVWDVTVPRDCAHCRGGRHHARAGRRVQRDCEHAARSRSACAAHRLPDGHWWRDRSADGALFASAVEVMPARTARCAVSNHAPRDRRDFCGDDGSSRQRSCYGEQRSYRSTALCSAADRRTAWRRGHPALAGQTRLAESLLPPERGFLFRGLPEDVLQRGSDVVVFSRLIRNASIR